MRWSSVFAILIASVVCAYAQQPSGTIEHTRNKMMKFENGLIISWSGVTEDASANQVDIFDGEGRPITSFNVLRLVPEAKRVSIYDVSASPGRMIAVAAVYASKEGNQKVRPTASLLLFDFGGNLLSTFALEPWRQISRLAIDDDANLWTLTTHADSKDTSTLPMVVEYSTDGAVVKELLPRSMFPLHAASTKENSTIGSPSMGYDSSSGLWFWLPGSTELVIVPAREGTPAVMKTGLPKSSLHEGPHNIVRESSGNVVAQIREDKDDGSSQLAYYTWSPSTKSWVRFKPGACNGDWLIGVGDNKQVYVRPEADRSKICVFAGE
jgi:hypothetical protein